MKTSKAKTRRKAARPAPAARMSRAPAGLAAALLLLKQLAHPVRLQLLCRLMHEGPQHVGALHEALGKRVSQSQLSQFLARLRLAGLVVATRRGRFIDYAIAVGPASGIIDQIYRVYCEPGAKAPSRKTKTQRSSR